MMELFAIWFVCAVVTAVIAGSKGRSSFGWLILGSLFGLFALILVIALPRAPGTEPTIAGHEVATPETHVKCPDCAELIKKEARVCKHCGCRLTPST